jgi:hypothetical protein
MLVLIPAGEDPLFVDAHAPVLEIAREPAVFLREATQFFGTPLKDEHLNMTVLELADYLNRVRTK